MRHVPVTLNPRDGDAVVIEVPEFEDEADARTAIEGATGSEFTDGGWSEYIVALLNVSLRQGAKAASGAGADPDKARDYMLGKPRGPRTGVTKAKVAAFTVAVTAQILSAGKISADAIATLRAEYGIPEDYQL